MDPEERIKEAVSVASQWGMIDGAHHKMWTIDQMLRRLLGDGYEAWVQNYNADEDYEDWDVGIAP